MPQQAAANASSLRLGGDTATAAAAAAAKSRAGVCSEIVLSLVPPGSVSVC